MTEGQPLLDQLSAQEERLVFESFDNDCALTLGMQMVASARLQSLPLTIDITRGHQQLFHAALAGTRQDFDHWIRRKNEVVYRFGRSTYFMAVESRLNGYQFCQHFGLDPRVFVAAGGGFPVKVKGVGLVGTVTVSGLAEEVDHTFVVDEIGTFLASA